METLLKTVLVLTGIWTALMFSLLIIPGVL